MRQDCCLHLPWHDSHTMLSEQLRNQKPQVLHAARNSYFEEEGKQRCHLQGWWMDVLSCDTTEQKALMDADYVRYHTLKSPLRCNTLELVEGWDPIYTTERPDCLLQRVFSQNIVSKGNFFFSLNNLIVFPAAQVFITSFKTVWTPCSWSIMVMVVCRLDDTISTTT